MAKGSKSWYMKGEEGWDRAKKDDEEAQRRREQRGPMRFWLQNNSAAKLVFLDNPNFIFYEHNLYHIKQEFWFETCIKDMDTCPICEDGQNPAIAAVCTIIRLGKWTDREGKEHKVQRMLFVAKGRAREKLYNQLKRREGSLVGCVYEVSRGATKTEAGTGEDFDYLNKKLGKEGFLKLVPKGEKPKEFLKAADYEKIFEPKSASELRKIIGAEEPVGSEDGSEDVDDLLNGENVDVDEKDDLDGLIDGDKESTEETTEEKEDSDDDFDLSDLEDEDEEKAEVAKKGEKKVAKKETKKAEPESIEDLLG